MIDIRQLDGGETRHHITSLAAVLADCVCGGASVSFMLPFTQTDAEAYFHRIAAEVERNERILLAAFLDSELAGTVQIATATPPNQPHRADIAKLLVHRRARSRGIGELLMRQAEEVSRQEGKSLLVLDTATGGAAERLYSRLGWTRVGVIPGYALYPDGSSGDTTFFYKNL